MIATATPTLRERYRALRIEHPHIDAALALRWAKQKPNPNAPTDRIYDGMTWPVDGFELTLRERHDECMTLADIGMGEWSNEWRAGALDHWHHNHQGERQRADRDQWYHPDYTQEQRQRDLWNSGMASGPAHNQAVAGALADYHRALHISDGDIPICTLEVEARLPDQPAVLGSATLGGVVSDETRSYLREIAGELAHEALHEARKGLKERADLASREERRERAWGLVQLAANGVRIKGRARALVAEERAEERIARLHEGEGVSG